MKAIFSIFIILLLTIAGGCAGRRAAINQTPLPWLKGAYVYVEAREDGWQQPPLRGIIEDGLRRGHGAIIIASGRGREAANYIAAARVGRHGSDVVAEIRIIGNNIIMAIGHGRSRIFYGYYGYSNEYDSYVAATRQALARLR